MKLRKLAAVAGAVLLGLTLAAAVPSPASAVTTGPYRLVVPGYDLCLDVIGASYADQARLQLYRCLVGQQNQQFRLEQAIGSNKYRIIARHSGKCVDVVGASTSNNAEIQQYTCLGNGQLNQIWLRGDGDGKTWFVPRHATIMCLYYPVAPVYEQAPALQRYCDQWNWYLVLA